jgi:hypothetical protein
MANDEMPRIVKIGATLRVLTQPGGAAERRACYNLGADVL